LAVGGLRQWLVGGGQWLVGGGQWEVGGGQWVVVSGPWSVVSGQWSMVRRQSSVVHGQSSVVSAITPSPLPPSPIRIPKTNHLFHEKLLPKTHPPLERNRPKNPSNSHSFLFFIFTSTNLFFAPFGIQHFNGLTKMLFFVPSVDELLPLPFPGLTKKALLRALLRVIRG
jgi:hypothetical protein